VAINAEKVYNAIKSGQIQPSQLNDEGKKAVREYILAKNGASTPTTQIQAKPAEQKTFLPVPMPRPTLAAQQRAQTLESAPKLIKPALGLVNKALDYYEQSPVGRFSERAGEASNESTFNQRGLVRTSTGNKAADWIAEKGGNLLGYFNPMGAGAPYMAAEKVLASGVAKTIGRKAATLGTAGAVSGETRGIVQEKDTAGIAKEMVTEGLLSAGGGAILHGLGKVANSYLQKGKLVPLEIPAPQKQVKSYGQLSVKNTALDKSVNEYNQAIEQVQNHFGTNQLRAGEVSRIKSELGINLDSLVKNIEKAESGVSLKSIAERNKMAQAAGVADKKTPTLTPRATTKTNAENVPVSASNDNALGAISPLFRGMAKIKETVKPNTAESFREKVNRTPNKKTSTFKETYQNLRTQFIDDLAPLEELEKSVSGKIASAEASLYKQARLLKGTPTKSNEIIRTRLAPILDSVEAKGYGKNDLGDYALAVHAKDLQAKGIETGFTPAEIDSVIARFGTPEMEAARKELINYSNGLLDELAASGRISPELVVGLRQKHPNYVPLFRAFDDNKVEFTQGLSRAIASVGNPIKELKGSARRVIDPLENIVKNTYQIINSADKTRVMSQLGKLAKLDKEGQFVRRLKAGEEVGRKNVVKAFENGQAVEYEVQPEIYKTLKNLDQESSNFLIEILSQPASALRAGATLTPEFSLRNPMRDVVQAFTVSKSGFNPVTDFPVALVQAIGKGRPINILGKQFKTPGDLYNQFLLDNGGYGNIMSMDRKVHREALQEVLKQPVSKQFINIVNPKAWLNLLRKISDTTETATKLGEYRAALRSGVSREEAAYRARDLMDFARAGYSIRPANRIVAFLNANIQGKSKLIRAAKENPVGVTARAMASITLPTVGVYMAQKYLSNDVQKQTIDDAQAWLKDAFWLMPIPGTNQVARIPKPFDLAPIFANLPERVMSYIDKSDPDAFDNFARDTFASYSIPVMISGFMPIIEGMANYSFFRDAPIIPQREKGLDYPDQYDINTSETSKAIARGINSLTGGEGALKNFGSPRVVENTIIGSTAGLGKLATSAIDAMLENTGAIDKPEKATKTPAQLPVLRAFLVNQTTTGKAVDDLYKMQDKLTRESGSAKLEKEGYSGMAKLKLAESATDAIGGISKQMRQIENSPKLSADEKRQRLDELNNRRNSMAKKAMLKLKTSSQ